jgi:hypothetical protein
MIGSKLKAAASLGEMLTLPAKGRGGTLRAVV